MYFFALETAWFQQRMQLLATIAGHMAKTKMGRNSIFRGKEDGYRVQAIITKVGGRRFDAARKELALLYRTIRGSEPTSVSDADVVEFLARGRADTENYIAALK